MFATTSAGYLRLLGSIAVASLVVIGCGQNGQPRTTNSNPIPVSKSSDDESEIHAAFNQYRKALVEGDGKAAWSAVDFQSRKYYESLLKDALEMPRRNYDRATLLHRLMVARLRIQWSTNELRNITGRDVFIHAVEAGWISKAAVDQAEAMAHVEITGFTAGGYLPISKKVPAFNFVKEKEGWKFALSQGFASAEVYMKNLQKRSKLPDDKFLLVLLRKVSKYQVTEEVFDRPR